MAPERRAIIKPAGHTPDCRPEGDDEETIMDRTTKILLAAIALRLWANAAAIIVKPASAQGEDNILAGLLGQLEQIRTAVAQMAAVFDKIEGGHCVNRKIC
jgi:hypothetical protein